MGLGRLNKVARGHGPTYTAVVGLGRSGLSCVRYLLAQGHRVAVTDSRVEPPGLAPLRALDNAIPLSLGGLDAKLLRGATEIVLSPGVSQREPALAAAIARGVRVVGDVELFARALWQAHPAGAEERLPVVAITGSNAKSTVTTLVGNMARRAGRNVRVGGNLGTPVLDLLVQAEGGETPDLYVLELSSFQLETTYTLYAAAGVVLNISPDHMDRYMTVDEYCAAKHRVYRGGGCMVINRDDPRVAAMARADRAVRSFGLGVPSEGDYGIREVGGLSWLARGNTVLLPAPELGLQGRHNRANALAALTLGEAVGLPLESMLEEIKSFRGLPHRCQWVAERHGVRWYNDSKATNVGATVAAVRGLAKRPGQLILIAGGLGKEADFSPLRDTLVGWVKTVILFGRDAPRIASVLRGGVPVRFVQDMGEAVITAEQIAAPGDTVLLSPACASFDMFSGYEERGEVFMHAVREAIQ
jgi:UDP-N-acetylmuramoylalanine--D-glutamate ligase